MYILHDLWNGELYPAENNCPADEGYRAARRRLVEREEPFWKQLSPAEKQTYEDIENIRSDVVGRQEQNAFVQGFRIGVQLMLDVLSGEGQQKRP